MINAKFLENAYFDVQLTSTNNNKIVNVKFMKTFDGAPYIYAVHEINKRAFNANNYQEVLEKLTKKGW